MVQSYIREIGGTLDTTSQTLADDLDALLQAEGPLTLHGASYFSFTSSGHAGDRVVITFRKPGPNAYRATLFKETPDALTLQDKLTAFLQANDTRRIAALLLVSTNRLRQPSDTQLLIVYCDSLLPSGVPGEGPAVILRAQGDIAPGATGAALLVTASGLGQAVVAKNAGPLTWKTGGDAYAYAEPTSDNLQAFPVGCNAA